MDSRNTSRVKNLDSMRFSLIDQISTYTREYMDVLSGELETYLNSKLHNTITDADGWLELYPTYDNVIHPCSIRFVPVKTNGTRSNVKRVVKRYDEVDTIEERTKFVLDHFEIID